MSTKELLTKEQFIEKFGYIGSDIYLILREQKISGYPARFAIMAVKWLFFKKNKRDIAKRTIFYLKKNLF